MRTTAVATEGPEIVTPATLRAWPLPHPGSNKEQRGKVLVVGGSSTTPGAVLLAGEAALRVGAGKLRLATASVAAPALAVAVPESAVLPLPTTEDGQLDPCSAESLRSQAEEADAVLLGPGLKGAVAAVELLEQIVPGLGTGLVLDALASAFVTEHPDDVPAGAVLTVNSDELDAIGLGTPSDVARRTGAVVLCGGTEKHVAAPDGRTWVVRGGGPGLGGSGSGDVQAGIVAGLVARGAAPEQAAVWAALLHARAGEEVAARMGTLGYLARELPPLLPALVQQLG